MLSDNACTESSQSTPTLLVAVLSKVGGVGLFLLSKKHFCYHNTRILMYSDPYSTYFAKTTVFYRKHQEHTRTFKNTSKFRARAPNAAKVRESMYTALSDETSTFAEIATFHNLPATSIQPPYKDKSWTLYANNFKLTLTRLQLYRLSGNTSAYDTYAQTR